MGVSADAPYLDSAYKLVQFGGRPVMKLSAGKATLPGAKQVYRGHSGDVIASGTRRRPRPPGTAAPGHGGRSAHRPGRIARLGPAPPAWQRC
jgi:hypothetical protein